MSLGALLIVVCMLMFIIERMAGVYNTDFPVIMLIVIFGYLLREVYRFREHAFSYSYQIYYFIGVLVSAIFISNGAEMLEINKSGSANGVFWMIAVFFISGLEASRLVYSKTSKTFRCSSVPLLEGRLEFGLMVSIVCFVVFLICYVFFKYSGPLILGIERSTFWNYIVPGNLSFIPSLLVQTFFFSIALWWSRVGGVYKNIFSLLVVVFYLFGTVIVVGQKFSSLIIYFSIFLFFVAAHNANFRISFKVIFFLVLVMVVVVALVVLSYFHIGRDATFILIRVALQSQLNWSVIDVLEVPWLPSSPITCFFGCQYETGRDYISERYLPPATYEHYKISGSGLSGFLPALPVLTFGLPLALVLHVLISMLNGAMQALLVHHIRHRNAIYSFLLFKAHFAIVLFWYAALHAAVTGPLFLLVIFLILFLNIVKHSVVSPAHSSE